MSAKKRVPAPEPQPLPEKLLDVKGVQDFLGVSRRRVFQLMKNNGLPRVQWDRTLRFDPRKLAIWLEEQSRKSA